MSIGREIPDWPKLLHLYSRLKPGTTVFEWMEAFEVHKLGVDVRRFTSFGVIKVSNRISPLDFRQPNLSGRAFFEECIVGPFFSPNIVL